MIRESKEKDPLKLKQDCYSEVYITLGKPSELNSIMPTINWPPCPQQKQNIRLTYYQYDFLRLDKTIPIAMAKAEIPIAAIKP